MSNESNLAYAFKDFELVGLGADLIRLSGLMAYCECNNINFYLCKDDVWQNVPKNATERNWLFYFKETIPLDYNDEFKHVDLNLLENCHNTPIPFNLDIDKFFYRSELVKKIYIPKDIYIEKVNKYINDNLPFLSDNRYIAVHIRRGDKVSGPWKEGESIQMEKYLSIIKLYGKLVNSKDNPFIAFIITDSDQVLSEISNYINEYKNYGIRFKWDKNEKRRDGYCYKLFKYGYDDNEISDEIFIFMKNMQIMYNSMEMVGARMSFLFIVAELLRGKKALSLADNKRYPVDFY